MDQEFRSRLTRELAAEPEPPIGDLIEASMRQGRRQRTFHRLQTGGVAVAVLAVVAGVALTTTGGGGPGPQVAGPGTPTPSVSLWKPPAAGTVTPLPADIVPWQPPSGAPASGPQVPATPAGVLELLLSLLPAGPTSGYAGLDGDGGVLVQTYLDSGAGPGMLRVSVARVPGVEGTVGPDDLKRRCAVLHEFDCTQLDEGQTSEIVLSGGRTLVVRRNPDNCVQHTVVEVHRPDGIWVQVNVAGCLAFDGTRNPMAPPALTVEQAAGIAADPRWGTTLAKSIVDAGAARFPDLPELV